MTTPTLLTTEEINGRTFTKSRALFVTPRGGCGVRIIHRIDRKTVSKLVWDAERASTTETEEYDPMQDFNYVGSRHHY